MPLRRTNIRLGRKGAGGSPAPAPGDILFQPRLHVASLDFKESDVIFSEV